MLGTHIKEEEDKERKVDGENEEEI